VLKEEVPADILDNSLVKCSWC